MHGTRHTIALVAHDNKKQELLEWVRANQEALDGHHLFATGTTGKMLARELELDVTLLLSGPVGGDQQIGAMIAEGRLDSLIFFWDPLSNQPHDPDVKALLRIGTVYNVPMALNPASADLLITSPAFAEPWDHRPTIASPSWDPTA